MSIRDQIQINIDEQKVKSNKPEDKLIVYREIVRAIKESYRELRDYLDEEFVDFADGDTTPDISRGNKYRAVNTGGTNITTFDNAFNGQEITILFTEGNTVIKDGATIQLSGGADFTGSANDIMKLLYYDGVFYEISRSVN